MTASRALGLALLACLLGSCATPPAPTAAPLPTPSATPGPSPEVQAYLAAAIDILAQSSYYRSGADWEAIRLRAEQLAVNDRVPAEAYDILEYLLRYEIGDRHAYLMPPDRVAGYTGAGLAGNPEPFAALVADRLGYLFVPAFASGDLQVVNDHAARLQDLIRRLDAARPCGWVVDLRENHGGNIWAMLAGLGPILGEGRLGAFDYGGGRTFEWAYRGGLIQDDGGTSIGVPDAYALSVPGAPVAVLTGSETLSSGEALAAAFRGRPATRSFGQPTGGYATAIELFPLPDGALLGITTALFADRTGAVVRGPLLPDEELAASPGVPVAEGVDIPQAALDWLAAQVGCAGERAP